MSKNPNPSFPLTPIEPEGDRIMTTATEKEAKRQLRQKLNSGLTTLTPEVAKLIMAAGGPTFRTVSGGFRCNQTGEKVGRGGTESYRRRVYELATPPKPVGTTNKSQDQSVMRPIQRPIPEVDISEPGRAIYCPNPRCQRFFDFARNTIEGISTCGRCGEQFRKIRQATLEVKPTPAGNIYCPHCYSYVGSLSYVPLNKESDCQYCHHSFIVAR